MEKESGRMTWVDWSAKARRARLMREKRIEGVWRRVLIEYEGEEGEEDDDEGAREEEEGEGVRRGVDSDGEPVVEPPLIVRASFSRDIISGWVYILERLVFHSSEP